MSFADHIRDRLPDGLTLPIAFGAVFDWAEQRGHLGAYPNGDPYLSIYPTEQMNAAGASHVLFRFDTAPLPEPIPQVVHDRYATVASIAGDGGVMGLWLDDSSKQQIVVFDHGSPFVLTDRPIVALQFLGLGYSEPAALSDFRATPQMAAERDMAEPPLLPTDYRTYLSETFKVTWPRNAADLGLKRPSDDEMGDPARLWFAQNIPDTAAIAPAFTTDDPFVVTKDMQTYLNEEGLRILKETYGHVILEQ